MESANPCMLEWNVFHSIFKQRNKDDSLYFSQSSNSSRRLHSPSQCVEKLFQLPFLYSLLFIAIFMKIFCWLNSGCFLTQQLGYAYLTSIEWTCTSACGGLKKSPSWNRMQDSIAKTNKKLIVNGHNILFVTAGFIIRNDVQVLRRIIIIEYNWICKLKIRI